MRYDPSNVALPCIVWHVPSCREIKPCMWVDDELHVACVAEQPYRVVGRDIASHSVPFEHMTINSERTLILLDPVADEQPADLRHAERVV